MTQSGGAKTLFFLKLSTIFKKGIALSALPLRSPWNEDILFTEILDTFVKYILIPQDDLQYTL